MTNRYEPASAGMLALAAKVASDNNRSGGVRVEVVEVDIGSDPECALAAGAVVCPTLVVEVAPHAPVRLEGVRSHRAVLRVLLPLLHEQPEAVAELRRQLESPNEVFSRRATRRRSSRR